MYKIILTITFAVIGLCVQKLNAQEDKLQQKIEILEREKVQVQKEEKEALKREVQAINDRRDRDEITFAEAQGLKEAAARKHARNIENKMAIIDNSIELLTRNEDVDIGDLSNTRSRIEIGVKDGNYGLSIFNDDDFVEYDRRTHSSLVVAFGLNNALIDGQSLDDSPYKVGGSRFFEIGWAWTTRVLDDSNAIRFRYGFSFQFNGLNPKDNQYFVEENGQMQLATFPESLDKAKFRMDNLVIPVYFEFGPSAKKETEEYIRYSTHKKCKFGIGAYAGVNLSARQKLNYQKEGNKIREKLKADYNTNDFIYGLSAYIGRGDTSLYFKYDLNPIFNDNTADQNNISLGVRFDL